MADLIKNKQWSDMDPLLRLDNTGRVQKVRGTSAIAQSIKNILMTMPFSRVRNAIGSDLFRVLHKPVTQETSDEIERIVRFSVRRYDNRIRNMDIRVVAFTNEQYYEITIRFQENDSLTYEEIVAFLDGRIIE